jgi:hybrid cluster-associated redox disulfide protein
MMSAVKKKVSGSDVITKDMPIGKVVIEHPETVDVFMSHGLHCIGCAAAHFENIAQGCEAHGIDADKLVDDLNKVVKKKK